VELHLRPIGPRNVHRDFTLDAVTEKIQRGIAGWLVSDELHLEGNSSIGNLSDPHPPSQFSPLVDIRVPSLVKLFSDNDVSNQQDATIFVYWSFYLSIWICCTCFGRQTRPSSGPRLTVYTALVRTIGADRWQDSISTLSPVGSNIGALYQSCIYSQKCSWRWASLSPEACRADPNRSIKNL